jgi:hypothetical protein
MNACAVLRPRPISIIPLLLLALVLFATVASWHAVLKHGPGALDAQNCFNGHGKIMATFMDPLSGQKMSICQQWGKFFVKLDYCTGDNCTMFPKEYCRTLQDVIAYVKRSGFTVPVK